MAIASVTITCTCCGKEFEHRHQCYNRRDADQYEAWASRNITLCPECQKAQYEEQKNAERAKACEPYTLPALTGTERQIAWAEKLRASWIAEVEDYITRYGKDDSERISAIRRAVSTLLSEHTDSRYWIDTRDESFISVSPSTRREALKAIIAAQKEAAEAEPEQPAEEPATEPETAPETQAETADGKDHPIARLTAIGYRFADHGDEPRRTDGKDTLYVSWHDRKPRFIPWIPDKVVSFTCGGDLTPAECAASGLTATVSDLYADFFGYDAEQRFTFDHKMSRRSWDYLERAKQTIGLISVDVIEDARPKLYVRHREEDEPERVNAEYVRVAHHDGALGEIDGSWLLELYEAGADSGCVYSFRFDRRPTEEDMDDAWAINELRYKAHDMEEVNYWRGEDLVTDHWTTIPGRPSEVLDHLSRCWF